MRRVGRRGALSLEGFAKGAYRLVRLPACFQTDSDLRQGFERKSGTLRGQRELLQRFFMKPDFFELQAAFVPLGRFGSW